MTKIRLKPSKLPDSITDWPSEIEQDRSKNLEMYYEKVLTCQKCKNKFGSDIKNYKENPYCPDCDPHYRKNFNKNK